MISCRHCKATNQDAAKYCLECGKTLDESMAKKAAGIAGTHGQRIANNARQRADSEFHGGVNSIINKVISAITKKIFGK